MTEKILAKIASALRKAGVPYMVIGGQAVLLYGVPRLTEDIDITLGVGLDKLDTIKALLSKMGLEIVRNADDEFVRKTFCLVALERKSGLRVDFIFSFTPYEQQAIKRSKTVRFGKASIKFAALEDLIVHKIFAGREKDKDDVRMLIKKNLKKIDAAMIRRQLRDFSAIEGYENILDEFEWLWKSAKSAKG